VIVTGVNQNNRSDSAKSSLNEQFSLMPDLNELRLPTVNK